MRSEVRRTAPTFSESSSNEQGRDARRCSAERTGQIRAMAEHAAAFAQRVPEC